MGGRAGRGERIGGRVARAPGCGRCLELLTPAAWLPPASQSSNKRGRRRGRRRSQESRRLHSHRSPSGSGQGARLLGGVLAVGVGAGQRERPSRRHPPLLPPRALRRPVGHRPPPHLPFSAFASVGASGHWRAAPGEQGMSPLHPRVVRVGMGLFIGEGGLEGGAGGSTRAGTSE